MDEEDVAIFLGHRFLSMAAIFIIGEVFFS
jgi:hypothetical protein